MKRIANYEELDALRERTYNCIEALGLVLMIAVFVFGWVVLP